MKYIKNTPSDFGESSGEIELMHVKNTDILLLLKLVNHSFLLHINVLEPICLIIGGLQHARTN